MTPSRRALVAALATGAGLLLGGCAAPPRAAGDWLAGRLSVQVQASAEQPDRSFAAAFELRGTDREGELRLLSPLGTQLAAARWSPADAVLATSDGELAFASLDEMALHSLGERVPLAALPDWVAGRPWRGDASRASAEGFEQLGWSVDTRRHADGRITARRDSPPVVTVRIVLDRPGP